MSAAHRGDDDNTFVPHPSTAQADALMEDLMTTARLAPPPASSTLLDVVDLVARPWRELLTGEGDPALLKRCRDDLDDVGCAVLPDFLTADALTRAREQCAATRERAFFHTEQTNPYNADDDDSLPAGHPRRFFMDRTHGFVARDLLADSDVICRLYHAPAFQALVAACLGEPVIHEYADPFAKLVLNVVAPGTTHPWHYDTNEFIVSMMVQAPEAGGVFEYCPGIRRPGDEAYDAVAGVLHGTDTAPVRQLTLKPGDLQLFKGRFALHRVTPVEGATDRLTAIFAYAQQPGMVGKPTRTRQLFGRVDPMHVAAERAGRDDGLVD